MFPVEHSGNSDQPLLQTILEPLLDDFQYWFDQSHRLLTSPKSSCLETEYRQTLLGQLDTAGKEIATARTLLAATNGQAGVETSMVMNWHGLVAQCWQASRRVRQFSQQADSSDS